MESNIEINFSFTFTYSFQILAILCMKSNIVTNHASYKVPSQILRRTILSDVKGI